jgi:hypothetical protein
MFAPPRYSSSQAVVRAAWMLIHAGCIANAQNFTARTADLDPFGVNGPLPFGTAFEGLTGGGIKGGFSAGISLQSTYDSNFFLTEDDPESDITFSLAPAFTYTTDPEGGARAVISASYQPVANAYLENSDLNSFDQSGSVSMVVSGSRTVISAYAGYSQQSGADRLAGGFFTGSALSVGLRGSYQLAPRTSVFGSLSASSTEYSNGATPDGDSSAEGYDSYSANIGGFWSATERFSLGPSFSYSTTDSGITGTRDSWGFAVQASYKAAERIQLAASLGVQHSENSRESDDDGFNLTGGLNASYQINELWTWGASIQSGVVPSPTQSDYLINNWSFSSSLNRQLLIGSAGFGLSFDSSNYESVGPTAGSQDSEEYFSAFLSYQRPLFNERVGFNTSLRYSFNNGQNEWSQIQLSAGLSTQF